MHEPAYLIVCVAVSGAVFVIANIPQSRYRVLLWFDALGLALFAVTGAERALLAGSGPVVAVTMGVITATFGGIIRDVLGNESPVVLSCEVYVTAALMGAIMFVVLFSFGLGRESALGAGLLTGLIARGMALNGAGPCRGIGSGQGARRTGARSERRHSARSFRGVRLHGQAHARVPGAAVGAAGSANPGGRCAPASSHRRSRALEARQAGRSRQG